MKIVYCIIDCSQSGGTERVIYCKANYLADRLGYDVTIVTTDQCNRPNFYPFSDKITFIDLAINYRELQAYSFCKRIIEQFKKRKEHRKKLAKILANIAADVVISTYTHEFTLLPHINDGSRKTGEIHFSKKYNQIENRYRKQPLLFKMASILAEKRKHLFIRRYDKFVVLTQTDLKNWKGYSNTQQIYNPLPFYPEGSSSLNEKRVISVGRLTLQKGFDLLIEAFRLVNKEFPDWRLDIFGTGEDEHQLRQLIRKYQLESVVQINPPTPDIIKEYLASSIYVMASRYEGFGMVLTEAMSCGLPCVSFDCPDGPSEIISDRKTGFLAENGNIVRLAKQLKTLIGNESLRKEMGRTAKIEVQRFLPDTIMKEWVELFDKLTKK